MCNTIESDNPAFPHLNIKPGKITQVGWKIFEIKNINTYYPVFGSNDDPFHKTKANRWNKPFVACTSGDGFCFFPNRIDALRIFDKLRELLPSSFLVMKKIQCKNVLATFDSNEMTKIWIRMGICKEFRILEDDCEKEA